MDALLHFPPPHNPAYERERDDAFSIWALERELEHAQHMADCYERRAGELYYDGHTDDAAHHYDLMDAANRHVAEVRQRLIKLEGGF